MRGLPESIGIQTGVEGRINSFGLKSDLERKTNMRFHAERGMRKNNEENDILINMLGVMVSGFFIPDHNCSAPASY